MLHQSLGGSAVLERGLISSPLCAHAVMLPAAERPLWRGVLDCVGSSGLWLLPDRPLSLVFLLNLPAGGHSVATISLDKLGPSAVVRMALGFDCSAL